MAAAQHGGHVPDDLVMSGAWPAICPADYIDFLKNVTPGNVEDHLNQLKRFNMGQIGDVDCPVFDGVYEYCQVRGRAQGAQRSSATAARVQPCAGAAWEPADHLTCGACARCADIRGRVRQRRHPPHQ